MSQPDSQPAADAGTETEVLDPITSTALANYEPLIKEVEDLRSNIQKTVYDLTKSKDNKEARRVRAALVAIPGKAEDAYKSWNQPRLAAAEKMRIKRDELANAAREIVKPLDDQITQDETRRAEEKAAEEKANAERVTSIRNKIATIMQLPLTMVSEPAEKITLTLDFLRQQKIDPLKYEEFTAEATAVLNTAIEALDDLQGKVMLRERVAAEQEQERARLAVQQAENERQRLENERAINERAEQQRQIEAQAEIDRVAREKTEKAAADAETARLLQLAKDTDADTRRQQDAFALEKKIAEAGLSMRELVAEAIDMPSAEILAISRSIEALTFDDIPVDHPKNDLGTVRADALVKLVKFYTAAKAEEERAERYSREEEERDRVIPEQSKEPEKEPEVEQPDANLLPPSADAEDALAEANAEAAGQQSYEEPQQTTSYRRVAPEEIVRPDDATIVHLVASAYGVSEPLAIEWLQNIDFDALGN